VKLLLFIFALYIAGLSVYPCYEDDCIEEAVIIGNADHESDHEDEEQDLCTPFCISACCSVHVYCSLFHNDLPGFKQTVTENSNYTIRFIPPVVISIWQPPKLALA